MSDIFGGDPNFINAFADKLKAEVAANAVRTAVELGDHATGDEILERLQQRDAPYLTEATQAFNKTQDALRAQMSDKSPNTTN